MNCLHCFTVFRSTICTHERRCTKEIHYAQYDLETVLVTIDFRVQLLVGTLC